MFGFQGSPGALQAFSSTAVLLWHGVALTLGTNQSLSHQMRTPQFEFARRAGLFHSQVHTVAVEKDERRRNERRKKGQWLSTEIRDTRARPGDASKVLSIFLLWTALWILIIQSSVPEQRANKKHMRFGWATTKRNLSSDWVQRPKSHPAELSSACYELQCWASDNLNKRFVHWKTVQQCEHHLLYPSNSVRLPSVHWKQ